MPNSTTSSSRPSSEFLDRMLLGARGGILQPEWVFHYFPDWKLSALASEWGIRAQPVTVICFNLHIYYTYYGKIRNPTGGKMWDGICINCKYDFSKRGSAWSGYC